MRYNGSDGHDARSPQEVAVEEDQKPDGRRNRCRVSGATTSAQFALNLQAGDRRCGRDCRAAQRVFPGCPFCPPAGFRPLSQAAGAGRLLTQPVARRRLAAVRTVQPKAALQLHPPAPPARHSPWRIVSFCAASAARSLASTAFCAISRSMLACKIATDVLSPVASAGCSGTRRRDSVGVTGAFRVEPRRRPVKRLFAQPTCQQQSDFTLKPAV